jgi:nucleosome binding factor SPN SPT16 subunit
MAEIKIDSQIFQERISHFVGAWKNDVRSKENYFNGASSIVILMGKPEDGQDFYKNNAVHVSVFYGSGVFASPNPRLW